MKVSLIAFTEFRQPEHVPWSPEAGAGDLQQLIEFAGRACYQSWSRPNPKTARNSDYIAHIIESQHFSVLEHASATFYIEGVSRSLTHELIRHRHLSYSQLSQRFVDESEAESVMPPLMRQSDGATEDFLIAMATARSQYGMMLDRLAMEFPDASRKQIREAARAVLPNATETKIVVTGNMRAWREVIAKRGSLHADAEIRALAIALLDELYCLAPAVFRDFSTVTHTDGTEHIIAGHGAS